MIPVLPYQLTFGERRGEGLVFRYEDEYGGLSLPSFFFKRVLRKRGDSKQQKSHFDPSPIGAPQWAPPAKYPCGGRGGRKGSGWGLGGGGLGQVAARHRSMPEPPLPPLLSLTYPTPQFLYVCVLVSIFFKYSPRLYRHSGAPLPSLPCHYVRLWFASLMLLPLRVLIRK